MKQESYPGHLTRQSNMSYNISMLFNTVNKRTQVGRPIETLEEKVIKNSQCNKDQQRYGHDRLIQVVGGDVTF